MIPSPVARRRGRGRAIGVALVAASSCLLGVGAVLAASGALAAFESVAETGEPGLLRLSSDERAPLWSTLSPGQQTRWLIRADLEGEDRGEVALELRAGGELAGPGGLTVSISACDGEFGDPSAAAAPACRGERDEVLEETPLADVASAPDEGGDRYPVGEIAEGDPRQFLVTLALPAEAATPQGETRVGLGVHARGDDAPAGEPDELAVTGADIAALALLAAGLVGIGAGVAALRRARRAA